MPALQTSLRERRIAAGWTQQALAERASVTRQTIAGIEAGRYGPGVEVGLRLARALGCRVEDLFVLAEPAESVAAIVGVPGAPAGRVALGTVRGRSIARSLHGLGGMRWESAAAGGLCVSGGAGTAGAVQRLGPACPTLFLAGCDPALGLLAAHTARAAGRVDCLWWHAGNAAALAQLARGEVHAAAVHGRTGQRREGAQRGGPAGERGAGLGGARDGDRGRGGARDGDRGRDGGGATDGDRDRDGGGATDGDRDRDGDRGRDRGGARDGDRGWDGGGARDRERDGARAGDRGRDRGGARDGDRDRDRDGATDGGGGGEERFRARDARDSDREGASRDGAPDLAAGGAGALARFRLGRWRMGWIVRAGNPCGIRGAEDLARPGVRLANREAGSGARGLLDRLLDAAGVAPGAVAGYGQALSGHDRVADAVAMGLADAGLGLEVAAVGRGLAFLPVGDEVCDLLLPADWLEADPHLAVLVETLQSGAFRADLAAFGPYDTAETGNGIV